MQVLSRVYSWVQILWAWLLAHLHLHVKQKVVPYQEWKIDSAFAFDEWGGEFMDITAHFDPVTWEDDIEIMLGWDRPRVDVRYLHTSPTGKVTKYRMVVRPGDECIFPPTRGTFDGIRGIISATLVPRMDVEGARPVDVTERVKKYAGPDKDFHKGQGLKVRVLDCFPFDDPDALVERFESLTILDATKLLSQEMHVFSLKDNDEINLA